MYRIIIILVLLISSSFGATYYIDDVYGSNGNDGLSPANAWQTVAKVGNVTLIPGDFVYFRSGQRWQGVLIPGESGTLANPITISAYDSAATPRYGSDIIGAKPIINGADLIEDFTSIGGAETGGLFVLDAEEGDVSEFTTTTIAGAATITADVAALNNGSYGFKILGDAVEQTAYGTKTFSEQADIYVRFYLYVPAGTSLGVSGAVRQLDILHVDDGASDLIHVYLSQASAGAVVTHIKCEYQSPFNAGALTAISLDTWYRIEIRVKGNDGSTGGYQSWIDGGAIDNVLSLNTTGQIPDGIDIGSIETHANGALLASGDVIYIDDIKSNTSAVGAYSGGASGTWYKGSVTTEPKIVSVNDTLCTLVASFAAVNSEKEWYWSGDSLYFNTADTSNIQIGQRNYGILVNGKDYITIDNLDIVGANIAGIYSQADADNLTIQNNDIYNNLAGIQAATDAGSNTTIKDNLIHNSPEFGIVWSNGGDEVNTIIQDNTIYNIGSLGGTATNMSGIFAKLGNGSKIQGNYIHDGGDGMNADHCIYLSESDTVLIRRNHLVNWIGYAVKISNCDSVQVAYNLCYGNTSGIIIEVGTPSYIDVFNNTMANSYAGQNSVGLRVDLGDNIVWKNNIIYDMNYAEFNDYTKYNFFLVDSAVTNFTSDNNLTFSNTPNASGHYAVVDGVSKTWAEWQGLGHDANGLNSNPLFTNENANNYIPTGSSPALNAGVSVGLTLDYAGNAVAAIPDIGAYEFSSGYKTRYKMYLDFPGFPRH